MKIRILLWKEMNYEESGRDLELYDGKMRIGIDLGFHFLLHLFIFSHSV